MADTVMEGCSMIIMGLLLIGTLFVFAAPFTLSILAFANKALYYCGIVVSIVLWIGLFYVGFKGSGLFFTLLGIVFMVVLIQLFAFGQEAKDNLPLGLPRRGLWLLVVAMTSVPFLTWWLAGAVGRS